MNKFSSCLIALTCTVTIFFISGCSENDQDQPEILISTTLFEEDAEGWEAQYAEYEAGLEDSLKFSYNHDTFMASPSIGPVTAMVQTGIASNSDLFMYIKREIVGFEPNATYSVIFNVEMFAQLEEDFLGDLSSTNNGAFLKVSVYQDEPDTLIVEDTENPGKMVVQTNFDKGENRVTGPNMALIGKLTYTKMGETPLLLVGTSEADEILGTADDEGKMWMMIGVDTNQPIYQSIFYSYIGITYIKK
jgi:hypothetical protein